MKTRQQLFIALLIAIAGGLAAFAIVTSPPQTEQQEDIVTLPSRSSDQGKASAAAYGCSVARTCHGAN